MNTELLIAHGNQERSNHNPEKALQYYAGAFINDHHSASAWNNYGNVMREMGHPERAIPFLQQAIILDPNNVTARFNLAVCYLQLGDYAQGWPAYEARWQYEHLAGTLPKFNVPRWTGQNLTGKTILVVGEQGHGDNIQFSRFLFNLHALGGKVLLQVTDGLIPLFNGSNIISWTGSYNDTPPDFDYWVPIMSIPGVLGITVDNIPQIIGYLGADANLQKQWLDRMGPKHRMRVGLCWSGRRDSWINQHKGMPFDQALDLVKQNLDYEWYNLQADASEDEVEQLVNLGVKIYPGSISSFADTAALIMNLDVVLSVDTAVAHLSAALARPTWVMLNQFAVDWRWLLNRDDSPWYSSARLFRQPKLGDWQSVVQKVSKFLDLNKI